jgi:hypothetical protein
MMPIFDFGVNATAIPALSLLARRWRAPDGAKRGA